MRAATCLTYQDPFATLRLRTWTQERGYPNPVSDEGSTPSSRACLLLLPCLFLCLCAYVCKAGRRVLGKGERGPSSSHYDRDEDGEDTS